MKKITLVLATMLLSVTNATAAKSTSDLNHTDKSNINRYRYSQPIMFVERGLEFLIFQNGEFDFNTNRRTDYSNNYFKQSRTSRFSKNRTYGAPGVNLNYTNTRKEYISYDRFGRIRGVGNVYINYDHLGRVKRIGSLYMRYHNDKLIQVGKLRLQYNRWGDLIRTKGYVNYSNQGCGFCDTTECITTHLYEGYNQDHHDGWNDRNELYNDNDDIYYYKKRNKKKKYRRLRSQ